MLVCMCRFPFPAVVGVHTPRMNLFPPVTKSIARHLIFGTSPPAAGLCFCCGLVSFATISALAQSEVSLHFHCSVLSSPSASSAPLMYRRRASTKAISSMALGGGRRALVSIVVGGTLLASRVTAADSPSKESRVRGAVMGSLVADALCLGSHYEYDAPTIKAAYGGTISTYMGPGERMGGTTHGVGWGRRNYHPGQKKGDQTDYGEYTLLMLEHAATREHKGGAISLDALIPQWKSRMSSGTWGAWMCTQTKQTLQQVEAGKPHRSLGGLSNAMAVRSAAALAAMESEAEAAAAARTMMFTHRSEEALSGGEFFTRVAWKVAIDGLSPREAIDKVASQMGGWIREQVW